MTPTGAGSSTRDGRIVRHTMQNPNDVKFVPTKHGQMSAEDFQALILSTPKIGEWDCFTSASFRTRIHFTVYVSVDHVHTDPMLMGMLRRGSSDLRHVCSKVVRRLRFRAERLRRLLRAAASAHLRVDGGVSRDTHGWTSRAATTERSRVRAPAGRPGHALRWRHHGGQLLNGNRPRVSRMPASRRVHDSSEACSRRGGRAVPIDRSRHVLRHDTKDLRTDPRSTSRTGGSPE
jgi:hypothetical protein